MRLRLLALPGLLLLISALSPTHGQDPRPPSSPPILQMKYTDSAPRYAPPAPTAPAPTSARDFSKLTDSQKQALLLAQRGATWLFNMNAPTGRFHYGYLPGLAQTMEGNSYLHQAAAAAALARAARLTGEKKFEARAAQALLSLLDETVVDAKDTQVRHTALPSSAQNRLACAGLLVAAIHELPAPQLDLLEKSDQLCNFIHRQARPDGSLAVSEPGDDGKVGVESFAAVCEYPGLALSGLMLSQRHRPAAWKTDLTRKALAYYQPWWRANKNTAFIPAQTAAYTEAFLLTKEPAFAAFVVEMNDWLCDLQYERPRVQNWFGGFKTWKDGRAIEEAPSVADAALGESLAYACCIARETADVTRHERYSAAIGRTMIFLNSLQFSLGNTRHFDAAYREFVNGGFHASAQDGNLRIDYTAQAVAALLQFVEQVR